MDGSSHETKHENSKNSEKIEAKCGENSGRKFEKFGELSFPDNHSTPLIKGVEFHLLNELRGKQPIKVNGLFPGTPAMVENGPSKRPVKRSMGHVARTAYM